MIYFKDVLQKKISTFTHKKILLVMLTFSLARFMQANRRNHPHVKNRAQMRPKIALIITAATSISLEKGGGRVYSFRQPFFINPASKQTYWIINGIASFAEASPHTTPPPNTKKNGSIADT